MDPMLGGLDCSAMALFVSSAALSRETLVFNKHMIKIETF